jgi:signal transduction histidine kinase
MPRGRHRASLRMRITAGALVVVVAGFSGAGLLVIGVLKRQLVAQIDSALTADADFTQRLMTRGSGLPMGEGPTDLYVQFVAADGRVLGAGTAAAGRPALARPRQAATAKIVTRRDPVLGELRVLTVSLANDRAVTLVLARSSTSVSNVRDSLIHLLTLLVGIGSMSLGCLIWVVVGRALRPVDEIRRTVDAIGERDLHRRVVKPGTGDELDGLADTLNALLRRLDASVTREHQFVADASHELRTPIAGVRALLETEPADPTSVVRVRAEALARLGQLQDLVEDLLVLAKADTGPHQPPRPVDLDELVLGAARQLARTTKLRIDTSRVSGGQVVGRDTDLGRLVENLATNAARYANTAVVFAVRQLGETVELTVADDGPGIDAEDRDRIFERFSTLEDSRGPDRSGAGLGLSIVSAIVAAHGGSIRVDEGGGTGARFVVQLPAHRTDLRLDAGGLGWAHPLTEGHGPSNAQLNDPSGALPS